jgi:uncharacterized protein HemY
LEIWWERVSWSVGAWFHRHQRGPGWQLPDWPIFHWWDKTRLRLGAWLFQTGEDLRLNGVIQWPWTAWLEERAAARATRRTEEFARAEEEGASPTAHGLFRLRWALNDRFWRAHEQVRRWGRARSWGRLAAAVPLILVAAAVAGAAGTVWLQRPEALVNAYRLRAARAFEAQDFPTARVCCERLAAFGDDEPVLRFRLQRALESLGRADRAAALLEELASPAGSDYAPAQVHRAEQLLAPGNGAAARQKAEGLLLRAGRGPGPADPNANLTATLAAARLEADPEAQAWLKAHQLLGQVYLEDGRPADAEEHLRAVIDAVPTETTGNPSRIGAEPPVIRAAHRLLGRLYLQDGRYRLAEQNLRAVAEQRRLGEEAAWLEVQVLLGRTSLALDQVGAAETYLLRAAEAAPAGPVQGEALAALGQLSLRARRYAEAEKYLQEALKAPRLPPVVRAEALADRGEFFLYNERYSEAQQTLRQALEGLPPGSPAARAVHVRLARLCLRRDLPAEAEVHLARATALPPVAPLVLTPGKPPTDEPSRMRLQRARALYREQARANPLDARAALRWAEAAAKLGDPGDAARALLPARVALPLLPYLAAGRNDLGAAGVWLHRAQAEPLALYRRGLAELDLRELQQLEGRPQDDPRPRWALLARLVADAPDSPAVAARLLAELWGRRPTADKPAEIAQSYRDEHEAAAVVRLLAALRSLGAGDTGQAKVLLGAGLPLAPEAAAAADRLAALLLLAGLESLPQAFILSDAAVAYYPREPQYRLTRSKILAAQGRWAAAADDLEVALRRLADPAPAHRALAEAYEHLGRPAEAEDQRFAADLLEWDGR